MQNRRAGLAISGLAIVAAVVLFIVLSGGDDSDEGADTTVAQTTSATTTTDDGQTTEETTTTTTEPEKPEKPEVATIEVKDGAPVGGVQKLSFSEGEDVRFLVESNVEDEVHLHGYNVTEEVAPDEPAKFSFEATIPGVFELELHHAVTQIAEIEVG
jgi:hypothetical protein